MQQTSTMQVQEGKMGRLRKISPYNILPSHNGALSHVAACVATLGFVIYSSSEKSENNESLMMKHLDSAVHFVHLLTFATWVGIQVWVHVSGKTYPTALVPYMYKCVTVSLGLREHTVSQIYFLMDYTYMFT